MRRFKYLAIILTSVLILDSCQEIEQLSAIPHIEFTSFAVFDSVTTLGNKDKAGLLKFYFEDGDGDVGLESPDISGSTDSINLFIDSYRKTDGIMVQITDIYDPVKAFNYRIPYMERTGQNKILKGTISITFLYTFYDSDKKDTIRYDFYIRDRAENVSDTVSTCEIPLSVNGIYTN
jgi:hypothetical protein